ncbi:MAG TPA: hypothetical protein VFA74_13045 [Terriglobales bacterium]|nr:hypothetical protein [Terriglobales bacterium]
MSRVNGDKSRFHRARKQNIQRRLRTKALLTAAGINLDQLGKQEKVVDTTVGKKNRA